MNKVRQFKNMKEKALQKTKAKGTEKARKLAKVAEILQQVLKEVELIMEDALKKYGDQPHPEPKELYFSRPFKFRLAGGIAGKFLPHCRQYSPEDIARQVALGVLEMEIIKQRIVHHFPVIILEKLIQAVYVRACRRFSEKPEIEFKDLRDIVMAGLDKVFNRIYSSNGKKFGGLSKALEEDLIYFWRFSFDKTTTYEDGKLYAEVHGEALYEDSLSI
ncbi:MAG: hypothetical protein QW733_02865 [Desulfurococcaceae archaeon]